MNKRIEGIYLRGLKLLDQFYDDRNEKEPPKIRKCKYSGCMEEIERGKYCKKHIKIRRKEAAYQGWETRNKK